MTTVVSSGKLSELGLASQSRAARVIQAAWRRRLVYCKAYMGSKYKREAYEFWSEMVSCAGDVLRRAWCCFEGDEGSYLSISDCLDAEGGRSSTDEER